jgi:hypothetical protein
MGPKTSNIYNLNPVNYRCPVCMSTGKTPNLAGRFFLIDEKNCQCNGCDSIFDKRRFYKPGFESAVNVKKL